MVLFIVRRLWLAALVCLTVLVVSFILTRLSGDLAASIGGPNASAADIAIIRKNYGLDRPLVVQFLEWAGHAAEGDLGRSFLYHVPVWGLIRDRLPVTLTLGLIGLAIALVIALPLGILAAVREGSAMDRGIMMVALLGQAMPGGGYLAWESIIKNDFPVVQAVVLFLAVIYIVLTLLADMTNALLDPRLRG